MKKKNILGYFLVAVLVFMGMVNVEAKTYTTYKVGDEITVNVNDSTQSKFLVIEDKNDTVKAIYKGALGANVKWPEQMTTSSCTFEGSVVDLALKERTSSWSNVTNITLPTANDIVGEFDYTDYKKMDDLVAQTNPSGAGIVHLENLNGVPFYALNNAEGATYFTNSVVVVSQGEQASSGCEIYVYGYAQVEFPYFYFSVYEEGSIRPIITVSKDYVVGGSYVSEEETLWNNFVEAFKKTELVKTLEGPESNTISITNTSDSLKVVMSDGTNSWTTDFTYANGVVTFVPSNNEDNALVDSLWVANCIYALAELKGYDVDKLSEWLDEDKAYTLAVDGIELETEEFTTTDENEFGSFKLTTDKVLSFKLDIKNGLKTFSNKVEEDKKDELADEVVENPKTGDATRYIILGLGVSIVIGTVAYLKSRKYSKFPQA